MKASLRGTEIYYDIAGMQLEPSGHHLKEKPIMFLLHGGPGGNHIRYKQHSIELQSLAQLVFIDHRGCGLSKKTKASDYTLENNIEDIEALRKHLGLEKIIILGTSYGGMVAQGYAIRYPKHVSKLILVATAPSFRALELAKKFIREHGTPKQIAMCEYLFNGTFKSARQVAKFFKLTDSLYSVAKKSHKKPYPEIKSVWSYEALNKGFGDFLRRFDFTKKLSKIKCPTLVLAGEKDWICPPSQSRIIAQNIPHAKLKIFKNCSHSIAVDAHKAYIAAISQFLRKKK